MTDLSQNRIVVTIDDYQFDLTGYASEHPGGRAILNKYKNKDATEIFNRVKGHGDAYVLGVMDDLCIGPSPSPDT